MAAALIILLIYGKRTASSRQAYSFGPWDHVAVGCAYLYLLIVGVKNFYANFFSLY